ncbi:MAG: hypothetical protein AAFQ94_06260 [Bacteroidota bacterium]
MMRKLRNADMNSEVLLWYNEILGEYFVGSRFDFEESKQTFQPDHINVLYTMNADSYAICNKIKNSLNSARVMVG